MRSPTTSAPRVAATPLPGGCTPATFGRGSTWRVASPGQPRVRCGPDWVNWPTIRRASAASTSRPQRRYTAGGWQNSVSPWLCAPVARRTSSRPPSEPGPSRPGCPSFVRLRIHSPRTCSPNCAAPSSRCGRQCRMRPPRHRCCADAASWSARSRRAAGHWPVPARPAARPAWTRSGPASRTPIRRWWCTSRRVARCTRSSSAPGGSGCTTGQRSGDHRAGSSRPRRPRPVGPAAPARRDICRGAQLVRTLRRRA